MLCPRCGEEKEEFVGKVCVDCFVEREDLVDVEENLSIDVCVSCGAVKIGGWRDIGLYHALDQLLEERVEINEKLENTVGSVEIQEELPDRVEATLSVTGTLGGRKVVVTEPVSIQVLRGVCSRCGKAAGGYYEAIIQVRARDREVSEAEVETALDVAEELLRSAQGGGGETTFVSRLEEVDGGVDLYLGDSALARELANRVKDRFGADISDSASLVGERDGHEIYRVTYLVRLPPFRERDVLRYDDRLFYLDSLGTRAELRALDTGERKRVPTKQLADEDVERVARAEDLREALVTMVGDNEVQVLDPDTMETLTLKRPRYLGPDDQGDETPVLRLDGSVTLVNPDVARRMR